MNQDPFGNQQYRQQPRRRGFNPRILILVLFAGYAAYYYFSNRSTDPLTGETVLIDKSISPEDEKAMGLQAFEEILQQEQPVDPNSQIAQQIRGIAQRLITKVPQVTDAVAAENGMQATHIERSFDWDVAVLNSQQANAFCLPGGKMAVYTGLLPVVENENGMAVVMGHEIAHALLRHGSQRMAQQKLVQMGQMAAGMAMGGMDPQQQQAIMAALGAGAQYGFVLPYGRNHETQADKVGLMLAAAACYNPHEAIPLWQRMSELGGGERPPEFASTHPDPANRIQVLQSLMPQAEQVYAKYCNKAAPSS